LHPGGDETRSPTREPHGPRSGRVTRTEGARSASRVDRRATPAPRPSRELARARPPGRDLTLSIPVSRRGLSIRNF
jgi:hypothetical protein